MLQTFAGRVGEQFRIEIDATTTIATTLASADSARGTGFSLVFTGPVEPLLPQRTYRMVHDELQSFDIFIVPIGRDDHGVRYEAVFN